MGGTLVPYSLSFKNCEGLTEEVGSLGLQSLRKNHSGAAKKRTRKARLAEAPTGDSTSRQSQLPQSSQSQILQESRTSGTQKEAKKSKHGPSKPGSESSERGPQKAQASIRGRLGAGR